MKKIKSRTKKILVLSVMIVLLVTTGVLNFVLNDKITSATDKVNQGDNTVTQTFFVAARSERDTTRESEFLYLDAIKKSENSSANAKTEAEKQKMLIVKRMEKELALETAIKGKGFEDAIVTIGDGGINVVVGKADLSITESNQIKSIVVTEMSCKPGEVKVIPYN